MNLNTYVFDVEVSSCFAYVGVLNNNSYQQLTLSQFYTLITTAKNSLFIGFNSNDYDGYDMAIIQAHYLTKIVGSELNTMYFDNLDVRSPYLKFNIPKQLWTEHIYNTFGEALINNGTYTFDLKDEFVSSDNSIFGGGSLKLLSHNLLGYEYKQTSNKIDTEYNIADLINTKALATTNIYNKGTRGGTKLVSDTIEGLLAGFEMFDIETPTLSNKLLVSKFIAKYIGVIINKDTPVSKYNHIYSDKYDVSNSYHRYTSNHPTTNYELENYDGDSNTVIVAQQLLAQNQNNTYSCELITHVVTHLNMDTVILNNIEMIRKVDNYFAEKIQAIYSDAVYILKNKIPQYTAKIPHKIKLKSGDIYVPLATGGIHYKGGYYYNNNLANANTNIYNIDFNGFYPAIYIFFGLFGEDATRLLLQLKSNRAILKSTNPIQANGIKLVMNTIFGKLAQHRKTLAITALSQYLMVELVETIDARYDNVKVIDINTDGIIISTSSTIDVKDIYLHSKLVNPSNQYVSETIESPFPLEVIRLCKTLVYKDCNNYLWNGKIKGDWLINYNITNSANCARYGDIVHDLITGDRENIKADWFKCCYKYYINQDGQKILGSDDNGYEVGYGYLTKMNIDKMGFYSPRSVNYKTIGLFNGNSFISDTPPTDSQVKSMLSSILMSYECHIPPKLSKNKQLTIAFSNKPRANKYLYCKKDGTYYTNLNESNLHLSEILNTDDFNMLNNFLVTNNASSPLYYKDIETNTVCSIKTIASN